MFFLGGGGGQFSSALFVRGAIMHATGYPKGSFPGAVSKGILSGSNNLWVSCLGAIIRGNDPGGNYPGGNFPREQLSSGEIVRGAIIVGGGQFSSGAIVQRVIFLGVNCLGTIIQGAIFLRGNCLDTV